MDELVRWLRAQLDKDERIARAVRVPPDWHQGPGGDPEWADEELVCMWPPEFHTPYERDKHWRGLSVEGPELAAHIAEHDPARVLREIDAKRRLLDLHRRVTKRSTGSGGGTVEDCARCDQFPAQYPCATVRLLALPYADREGYQESWRP